MRLVIFFLLTIWTIPAMASDVFPVSGIMHIQSNISDGIYSIDEIAKKAIEKGIGVVFITDHDMKRWEYGFPPFRRLLRRVVEEESVLRFGPVNYLELIKKAEKDNRICIIPGVEAAPFYYWSGNAFKKNMELNAWHRHMLVVGLDRPEDYENLPLVSNRKSRFDQYHGDMWFKPHQDLIDYVNKRGGMTFWAHPEAENAQVIGGILIHTIPYTDFLLKTHGFAGFGILHEGYKEVGCPGGIWDKMLLEYVSGKRKDNVVAIGEMDYEGRGNETIDDVLNVFFVRENARPAIMEALRCGRFYVVRKSKDSILSLDKFEVSGKGKSAFMGETIYSEPVLRVAAAVTDARGKAGQEVLIKLIRNADIIDLKEGTLPMEYEFLDTIPLEKSAGYYRLEISSRGSLLLTNPIFFKYENK